MPEAVLAVDLGGTQMRAALVGASGTVEIRRSRPTPQDEECPDALLAAAPRAGRRRGRCGRGRRGADRCGRLEGRRTCRIAGYGDLAGLRDELAEWDYGAYEGLTTAEIRERDPGLP